MDIQTKHIHLNFLALLLLLASTIAFSFLGPDSLKEYSTYGFAILKSLLILFIFMGIGHTRKLSLLYAVLALITLGILITFVLDDVMFRA
jgi:caa(3)-type oxidase subunit IV